MSTGTQHPTTTPAGTRRGTTPAGVALVVLAVGQVVSGGLISTLGDSALMQPNRAGEPAITPPGYAFAIWGLIEAFSLGLALWLVWFRGRADDRAVRVVDALTRALLVVFAGFTVWLVASVVEPVWATLAVFVVMGVFLGLGIKVAVTNCTEVASWSPLGRALVWGTLGFYTGWSTVAIWLNLTTALAFSGAPVTGTLGVVGQLAVLAGATATAVLVLRWTGGLLTYAGAVLWALVGATIGSATAGQPVLAVACAVGVLVVAATAVALRLRRRGTRPALA